MKPITLTHRTNRSVLFSGQFETIKQCLEAAVAARTCLSGLDVSGHNLVNANLDGGDLRDVVFDGCNLSGANLSEADLTGASFRGADMSLVCLCDAHLHGIDFTDASFAGTLLAGASVDSCTFTCPTALHLPFIETRMGANTYKHDEFPLTFTASPGVVTGLPKPIVFLDDAMLIGSDLYACQGLPEPMEILKKLAQSATH